LATAIVNEYPKRTVMVFFQEEERGGRGHLFATSVHQSKGATCYSAIVARNGNIANALALRPKTTTQTTRARFAKKKIRTVVNFHHFPLKTV